MLTLFCTWAVALSREIQDSEFIVVMKPAGKSSALLSSRYSTQRQWTHIPGFTGFLATLTDSDREDLSSDPEVAYIEPNEPVYALPLFGEVECPVVETGPQSWGQGRVTRVNGTGDYRHDPEWGKGVDLYIIDTGTNCEHEEFDSCDCGPTFSGGLDGCSDGNSHGTFCGSIAAGKVYGIAKGAHIIGVKVLSDSGMGSTASVISGMDYVAAQSGTRVASMSLGGGFSQASNDAADALVRAGVTLAVAAGNDNSDACSHSPASAPLPICVGSTDKEDQRSFFSNYGSCTDVFAPGSDITGASNKPGTYVTGSGTSMATPHVAGVLAALRSMDHTLCPWKLKTKLLTDALNDYVADVGEDSPNRLLHLQCEGCRKRAISKL